MKSKLEEEGYSHSPWEKCPKCYKTDFVYSYSEYQEEIVLLSGYCINCDIKFKKEYEVL